MSLSMWIITGIVVYFILGIIWSVIHARCNDFIDDNNWFDDFDLEVTKPVGVILTIIFWVFPFAVFVIMCVPTALVKYIISRPYCFVIRNTWFRLVGWNSFEERDSYKPPNGQKINKKVCRSCLCNEYNNCHFVFRGYGKPSYERNNDDRFIVIWDVISKNGSSTTKRCVFPDTCNHSLEHLVMNKREPEVKEAKQKA